MTCKISFIKSIRETTKHHLAVFVATGIMFFIQFIVFFLNVQNVSISALDIANTNYLNDRLLEMTIPSAIYVVPVVISAILLGYDFFRSLHSKKQTDFYESLPIQRKDSFFIRVISAFLVFLIPYVICTVLEIVLLAVYGFINTTHFINLLWNAVCMILIFLTTFFTAALAMIMTGHPVIAAFGFGVFSAYVPILLRYVHSSYAVQYFDTYVGESSFFQYFEYFSPFGLMYRLLDDGYLDWTAKGHIQDFSFIIVMILVAAWLSFYLFLKRPSEAAGRAMAFEKLNPFIRILLVIPISLYIGLGLSLVASIGEKVWMIFGFLIGSVLLHGVIESIFQFDIRAIKSHKRQMVLCFGVCITVALIYWYDVLGYDRYLPDQSDVESISIQTQEHYRYSSTDDGIGKENIETALQLAQNLIEKEAAIYSSNVEWIQFTYHLKNGTVKQRSYAMHLSMTDGLLDKLFATKEVKDDICALYDEDWENVAYIQWNDYVGETALSLSEEELEHLFETYLAEYTPLTYSEMQQTSTLGYIYVNLKEKEDTYIYNYRCDVYPQFTQTIALLERYLSNQDSTKDYGSLSESAIYKYPIISVDLYHDEGSLLIKDTETIELLKEHMIPARDFDKEYYWQKYYYAGVSFLVNNEYIYLDVYIPREVADSLPESTL